MCVRVYTLCDTHRVRREERPARVRTWPGKAGRDQMLAAFQVLITCRDDDHVSPAVLQKCRVSGPTDGMVHSVGRPGACRRPVPSPQPLGSGTCPLRRISRRRHSLACSPQDLTASA